MKLAIMQPYLFPYIGYFQLINAVDKFIFYDDVNYIKKGWINKNKIIVNKKEYPFAVPLTKVSQNVEIKETYINRELFEGWKIKFLQTLTQNYKKAPHFNEIYFLINRVLENDSENISNLAIHSVKSVAHYLDIDTEFSISSKSFRNKELERQDRLIQICKIENATNYINALGGQELYTKDAFLKEGVNLHFLQPTAVKYKQFSTEFVPWLSIIDILMFNSVKQIKDMMNQYTLL